MIWPYVYATFPLVSAAFLFWQFVRNFQAGEITFAMRGGKPPAVFSRVATPKLYWLSMISNFIISLGLVVSGLQLLGVPVLLPAP